MTHLPRRAFRLLILLSVAWGTFVFPCWAQLPAERAVVAYQPGVGPGTALVLRTLPTGTSVPLPGFSRDIQTTTALCIDPANRDVILALAAAGGGADVVRLGYAPGTGPSFLLVEERLLASFPYPVAALSVRADTGEIIAAAEGANGGLWGVPRRGGAPRLILSLPWITAFHFPNSGSFGITAQTQPAGDPDLTFVDADTGTIAAPVPLPGLAGRRITGVADLPTGAVRQTVTDDQGGIYRFEFLTTLLPLVNPPLPAASAEGLRLSDTNLDALVLGFNALRTIDFNGNVASTIPVTPTARAFDVVPLDGQGVTFGSGYPLGNQVSFPRIGTVVTATCQGTAATPTILGIGTSDRTWGAFGLPLTLASGWDVLVAPDLLLWTLSDSNGTANIPFLVPNDPNLIGASFFTQWGQPVGPSFELSAAIGLFLGL